MWTCINIPHCQINTEEFGVPAVQTEQEPKHETDRPNTGMLIWLMDLDCSET